jgi:VWFA-related protein
LLPLPSANLAGSPVVGLIAAAAVAAAAAVGASPAFQARQSQPVFRARANYVEVDVVVTDGKGRMVRGLTRDDFTLSEDGKTQQIETFSFVDIPLPGEREPAAAPAGAGPPPPAVAGPDAPRPGRVFLLVLDTLHVDATRTPVLRRRAREFVERHVGEDDRVAVAHIGYPQHNREFTTDKTSVLASIDRLIGEKTESPTVAAANADGGLAEAGRGADPSKRARRRMVTDTVFALQELSSYFATLPDRRKTLVLFSEGLDVDMSADLDLLEEVRDLFAAAARANVAIYTVDPRGVASIGDDLILIRGNRFTAPEQFPGARGLAGELAVAQHSLRTLAENTGGLAAVGSSNFARAFERIIQDASTYYLLGYHSTNQAEDGTFRSLTVRVRKSDLDVRARKGYVAERRER